MKRRKSSNINPQESVGATTTTSSSLSSSSVASSNTSNTTLKNMTSRLHNKSSLHQPSSYSLITNKNIPRGGSSKMSPKRYKSKARSRCSKISTFVSKARDTTIQKIQKITWNSFTTSSLSNNGNEQKLRTTKSEDDFPLPIEDQHSSSDFWNYALLIVLYTLQGIPMGLSASIPFLLQEKISKLAAITSGAAAGAATAEGIASAAASSSSAAAASYNANAIFALCSWPFSLKLLWAPIVDACYIPRWGRRKTWLVPVQTLAGLLLVSGAKFVQEQFATTTATTIDSSLDNTMNIKGLTMYFLVLYFLMATQDIAVDGWALTLLKKKNRGKGPVCNSIGQNIGYFLSFVGFLALNDPIASEKFWRPLLRIPRNGPKAHLGIVSLQGFLKTMGISMLIVTWGVAIWKREVPLVVPPSNETTTTTTPATKKLNSFNMEEGGPSVNNMMKDAEDGDEDDDDDEELDASQIGVKETYHRLWAVCQLPAVRWLFLILVTYRLPTALSDNVKFLKAVELGMSKSTTALLSPLLILPLGIIVPLVAHKIWHQAPLQQFTSAYIFRVTLVPLLDTLMLKMIGESSAGTAVSSIRYWLTIIASTAAQAVCNSLQFNAQMTFFAHRVDPLIGGSYMTLLNTAANLGGTWPSSFVMELLSVLSKKKNSSGGTADGNEGIGGGNIGGTSSDPYYGLQAIFSILGIIWMVCFGRKIKELAALPDDAWRTHSNENDEDNRTGNRKKRTPARRQSSIADLESGDADLSKWRQAATIKSNKNN